MTTPPLQPTSRPVETVTPSPRNTLGNLFALAITLAAFGPATVGISQEKQRSQAGYQWDVLDLRFESKTLPAQPVDATFQATFQNADGKQIVSRGFFNGGNEFLIRFTPPSAGTWSYVTESSLQSLNGLRGQVKAGPARSGRKGGITLDPKNNRAFRYENGDSYYPIAFESDWLFALDAENPDDFPVTRRLIDTLAENGFNQVVLNVFAYDVNWPKDDRLESKYEFGSPQVFPFHGTNTEPDHSQLNIEYFKRFDRVIDYLDKKGIAAHLMVYVWNKNVNWPEANSPEDNRYFDYVIRRYQAYPNLVWDISKEALGYGHNDVNYISSRIDRLRELDSYHRPVTVHDYSYCRRFSEKLDFISVQIWSSELYGVMRNICKDLPGQPILNIEHGGYEQGPYVVFTGSYTSPEVCLERAYQCVFAGTFPTHYWQGAAWNVIIPDIDAMAPDNRPRLDYYRNMRSLVDKYDVANLQAGDKKSNSGFCLHNGNDRLLFYVPKENINIGVRLPKEMRGGTMTGTWFDPLTGKYDDAIELEISQWPSFDKPETLGFGILIVETQAPKSETK
ncbi:MAG: DUF4038 domain-containing protein [Rubripirellula sp.]